MTKINRIGKAQWSGGIKDGKRAISTEGGALNDYPYGFSSRFEGQKGSNPEELLGAAHAARFTMALSLVLENNGLKAEKMEPSAKVGLEKLDSGWTITTIHLTLEGKVPGATQDKFAQLANEAKTNCPLSKVLKAAEISLDARLV